MTNKFLIKAKQIRDKFNDPSQKGFIQSILLEAKITYDSNIEGCEKCHKWAYSYCEDCNEARRILEIIRKTELDGEKKDEE